MTDLSNGEGDELSYVRDSMNRYLDSENHESRPSVTNREVKVLLTKHFGDRICFSQPKQVNKSLVRVLIMMSLCVIIMTWYVHCRVEH